MFISVGSPPVYPPDELASSPLSHLRRWAGSTGQVTAELAHALRYSLQDVNDMFLLTNSQVLKFVMANKSRAEKGWKI